MAPWPRYESLSVALHQGSDVRPPKARFTSPDLRQETTLALNTDTPALCVRLLGPYTGWVAIHFLFILEARNQSTGDVNSSEASLVCRWTPHCMYLCRLSFRSPRPTSVTWFYLNYLIDGFVSRRGHVRKHPSPSRVRTSA